MNEGLVRKIIHDMRSPLMGIHGNLELAKLVEGNKLSAKGREYIDASMAAAIELNEIVASLLDVGMLQSGERALSRSKFDLTEVCRRATAKMPVHANEIPVEIKPSNTPIIVSADLELVQRVLYILINNALRYSPRNGRVTVTLCNDERCVSARVSDRGPVIPADTMGAVFDMPAAPVAGNRSGPGLGLVFCKTVVEAHGGRIGVECPGGKETVFWFDLPLG